jgi:hypothetical protein
MKSAFLLSLIGLILGMTEISQAADKEPNIGHIVFFKLKDGSADSRKKLVEACDKYLSGHDGTIYYSAGVIGESFKRDVNDRDWDVALHLIFKDKASLDKYHAHKRHDAFVDYLKPVVDKVRVFDSEIAAK